MKKRNKILLFILYFFSFFAFVGFTLTCNMVLFLSIFSRDSDIIFTEENTYYAAIFTFWNAVFLGFVFAVFNFMRRKITIEKPTQRIIDATDKITNGDFSTRIKPIMIPSTLNEYNKIIENLNKMTEELSGIETLRTDFISNVSHELKTPLAVLHNYGTLLEQPDLSDEKRIEYAKTIVSTSAHLSNLISNILKLNKLENQKIYPNKQKFCLSEQLCEIALAYENSWLDKKLDFKADIEDNVFIKSDPDLIKIVWTNLLSNAFKYTDKGSIGISLKNDGTKVKVSISDTGCGMNEETIKHIFDKFYQGDTSRSSKGNGLGLALVKKVVDLFDGEIIVESTPGIGSTFTVILDAI